jgi:predicted GIY-YIG superfamily endonuclease
MKQVYLLESLAIPKQFYVGLTSNLEARLQKHSEGGTTHTAQFRPWKLVVSIRFEDDARARQFERYLTSPSGRAFTARHFR